MLPIASESSPQVDRNGDVKIVRLLSEGASPFGDDALALELEACRDESTARHLLLDFANVQYITSTELGTIIVLHKHMTARGGRLTLFNLREEIHEIFMVTRLHTFLEINRRG